jgi:hypothetical protein
MTRHRITVDPDFADTLARGQARKARGKPPQDRPPSSDRRYIRSMAASTTTLALIGAGGVVLGALVGGISGWGTAMITGHRARKDAQEMRRREAYTIFLAAIDRLDRFRLTQRNFNNVDTIEALSSLVNEILEAIHLSYAAIHLAGSKKAQDSAEEVIKSVWIIHDILLIPVDADKASQLRPAFEAFVAAGNNFVAIVWKEFN